MTQKLTHKESIFVIYLLNFLERFCYFGVQGIISLYIVDEGIFNISSERVYYYYGIFMMLISVLPAPLGLIIDLFLKPKSGFLIGASIAVLSYGLLIIPNLNVVFVSMIFLTIATNFMRPSIFVLFGQLYNRKDRKRNNGFIAFLLTTDLGGICGSLFLLYFYFSIGSNYNFIPIFFIMIIIVIIFYNYKDKLNFQQFGKELIDNQTTISDIGDNTLLDDTFLEEKTPHIWNSNINLIILLMFLTGLYWSLLDLTSPLYNSFELFQNYFNFLNNELNYIFPISTLLVAILLIIIGTKRNLGGTISKLGFAFIILGILVFVYKKTATYTSLIYFIPITWLFVSFAEVVLRSFVLSYITRVSNPKYVTTTIGFVFLTTYVMTVSIEYLNTNISNLIFGGIGLAVGIGILLFRKQILALANGID